VKERLRWWENGEYAEPRHGTNKKASSKPSEEDRKRRVLKAAQNGQYGKAATALSSLSLAPTSAKILDCLCLLHASALLPATSDDPPPELTAISEDCIKSALSTFPEGTAPGPSSLRAAFLKEAAFCPNSDQAAKTTSSLTKLVNLIAAGKCSPDVAPLLCGASLFALLKKEPVSIRPIPVGEV
jgi:hypothetical protein